MCEGCMHINVCKKLDEYREEIVAFNNRADLLKKGNFMATIICNDCEVRKKVLKNEQ